ncbi:ABC transporter ATP-binding protein [Cryptosporangium arvum]|uniref:ABC-type multidrug transport system, ATPase and permease component n=1 Tax=Cryptosporangium arvum DSM 44712 TaxID=927661 RepID=A0A010ZZY3_9ACTN|nr:ABC transporter ATP-binding protein [Cryptosporangium arvum]EXG82762.1 ABC-type multidrug transport system, ATPase and permease component [Cryptosporangium arvum DSM 44712]
MSTTSAEPVRTTVGAAFRLAGRAAPRYLAGAVAVAAASAAAPAATAWLTRATVDGIIARAGAGELLALVGGLAAAGIAVGVLPHAATYARAELGRRSAVHALDELYRAVERQVGLRRFEDPPFLDRLRMAGSGGRAPGELCGAVLGAGTGLLGAVGLIAALALVSPLMTVVVLAAAVPVLVMELTLARQRAAVLWRMSPAARREFFFGQLLGHPVAAKEVRLFGLAGFLRERMLSEHRAIDVAQRRVDRRALATQGGLALLGACVAGGGLIWAVFAARDGRLGVGDVTMFVVTVAGLQAALAGLVSSFAGAHASALLFAHHRAVLATAPDLPLAVAPRPVPVLHRGIELRDVWFRYADDKPWVLRGVTFTIPHGLSVALAGHNGAGKTTIVKLLCRLYDPTMGTIHWDGVDLRDVPIDDLRRRIATVFQDYMEYDLTAAENIGLGDLAARHDRDRITGAARLAGIDDLLAGLPQGYDTMLSQIFAVGDDPDDPETGTMLSGGQWQRVALARALMRGERDLLVLDEPTAGLDAEAEHEIHARLRAHRAGRTSLLISHRLGAVADADRIVVLRDGVVAEEGDHTGLMAARGTYARLFALQASGYTRTGSEG